MAVGAAAGFVRLPVLGLWRSIVLIAIVYFAPVAAIIAVLVLALGKELLFTSFDPETAVTYRIPVWLYDVAFLAMLALVIVFATKMLGLMLVFAYLVAPGTASLMFCKRMPPALAFSVAFAAVMSLVGLGAAAIYDLPPGPAVTAMGVGLLLIAFLIRWVPHSVRNGWPVSVPALSGSGLRIAVIVGALIIMAIVGAAV